MILALLGTSPYPFERLFAALKQLALEGSEKIVVQAGSTQGEIEGGEVLSFLEIDKLRGLISEATVVICQGGIGSIGDALRAGKPVVAVPRLEQYNELRGDQTALVDELANMGLVIPVYDLEKLSEAVSEARSRPRVELPESQIPVLVRQFVQELLE